MDSSSFSWADVTARLAPARTYWLGTTTASGAPHAAPVWGVIIGETLHLYTERSTVKARNLAADPLLVGHLEFKATTNLSLRRRSLLASGPDIDWPPGLERSSRDR